MEVDDIELKIARPKVAEAVEQKSEDAPLKISMGISDGDVFIMFSKPVTGLRFNKKDAREFATRVNKQAIK